MEDPPAAAVPSTAEQVPQVTAPVFAKRRPAGLRIAKRGREDEEDASDGHAAKRPRLAEGVQDAAAPPGHTAASNSVRRVDSEDEEDEGGVNLAAIRQLREEQRARAAGRGVDADALNSGDARLRDAGHVATAPAAPAGKPSGGDAPTPGLHAGGSKLGSGFAAAKSIGGDVHDPRMQAFIESRLKQMMDGGKGGAGGASGSEADAAAAAAAAEAESVASLYKLPAHLSVRTGRDDGSSRDGDVGLGGMMIAGVGMAEVTLPEAVKERNAAATVEAAAALAARLTARRDGVAAAAASAGEGESKAGGSEEATTGAYIASSVSSNFSQHRKDWHQAQRRGEGGPDGARRGGAAGSASSRGLAALLRPSATSSDNVAFSRFKRQELGKERNK